MSKKPVIGMLLGDPTGIGPELSAKLLAKTELYDRAHILVVGDQRIFRMGQKVAQVDLSFPVVHTIDDVIFDGDTPVFLNYPTVAFETLSILPHGWQKNQTI